MCRIEEVDKLPVGLSLMRRTNVELGDWKGAEEVNPI